ncbi:MAG: Rho termination factor N-terminal domain-containing protein, partial [Armatimonadetes bacterium]|nr:Rho termination factor N-terminal domain-containing protein [Armatimonadota bacterium]
MALELAKLDEKSVDDLHELAKELSVEDHEKLRKPDLVLRIMRAQAEQNGLIWTQGVLEILPEGYGFLRVRNFLPSQDDIYVSQSQVKRFGLKTGDTVIGAVRMPKSGERYRSLLKLEAVNGLPPDEIRKRTAFDELTPIYPADQLHMETTPDNISGRFIDIVAPIGKGQRGLIVSPPKAGKTTLLKLIANSITANHPEVY